MTIKQLTNLGPDDDSHPHDHDAEECGPPRYNFFVDRSGNTGDLATDNLTFTFGSQPMFALAAIGIDEEDVLKADIEELKRTAFNSLN